VHARVIVRVEEKCCSRRGETEREGCERAKVRTRERERVSAVTVRQAMRERVCAQEKLGHSRTQETSTERRRVRGVGLSEGGGGEKERRRTRDEGGKESAKGGNEEGNEKKDKCRRSAGIVFRSRGK